MDSVSESTWEMWANDCVGNQWEVGGMGTALPSDVVEVRVDVDVVPRRG